MKFLIRVFALTAFCLLLAVGCGQTDTTDPSNSTDPSGKTVPLKGGVKDKKPPLQPPKPPPPP